MTILKTPEQVARSNGWTDFEDVEDATILVVAHDDRPVHFTGASAWAEAVAWDAQQQ